MFSCGILQAYRNAMHINKCLQQSKFLPSKYLNTEKIKNLKLISAFANFKRHSFQKFRLFFDPMRL